MRTAARGFAALLVALWLGATPASADVHIEISLPVFPQLVLVPGYPVYYAPSVHANYFFYDGLYWVFNVSDGYWYSSSWYNGPWVFVEPMFVPSPLLVVPSRYYRVRPPYWRVWTPDHPPRWGDHWGREWEVRRRGWDHWDRNRHVPAAPLPLYQRRYERDRYPAPVQQRRIYGKEYRYRPSDDYVRRQQPGIIERQEHGGAKAPKAQRPPAPPRQQPHARPPQQQRHGSNPDRRPPERQGSANRHPSSPPPRQAYQKPPQHQSAPRQQQGAREQHAKSTKAEKRDHSNSKQGPRNAPQ
jgi:hypothetical protein